jgi:hypothetical protein
VEVSLRFKQVSNPKKNRDKFTLVFSYWAGVPFFKMGWTIKIGHDLVSVVVKGNKVF